MPSSKAVARIVRPLMVNEGAGVRLKRVIPNPELGRLEPFVLFDDFSSDNPEDFGKGFPWHSHSGVEIVTYVLAGAMTHQDSLGNAGMIAAGDAQWMTAGSGIVHEEMPDASRGKLLGFQLWMAVPAAQKHSDPRYQSIDAGTIPEVAMGDGVIVRVIAGSAGGVRGPLSGIAADPLYLDVQLPPGASYSHDVREGDNAFAYVFQGSAGFKLDEGEAASIASAPALVALRGGARSSATATNLAARYLLISARPIAPRAAAR